MRAGWVFSQSGSVGYLISILSVMPYSLHNWAALVSPDERFHIFQQHTWSLSRLLYPDIRHCLKIGGRRKLCWWCPAFLEACCSELPLQWASTIALVSFTLWSDAWRCCSERESHSDANAQIKGLKILKRLSYEDWSYHQEIPRGRIDTPKTPLPPTSAQSDKPSNPWAFSRALCCTDLNSPWSLYFLEEFLLFKYTRY